MAVFESLRCRIAELEQRVGDLEARLKLNSTNSSKPPSSDPIGLKRKPPAPPTGRKRGGQPGHARAQRPLVPPEKLRSSTDCRPTSCRRCGHPLLGDDPDPLVHQVAELPKIEPIVDEYRLHRLTCPHCGATTCGTLPEGVPTGQLRPVPAGRAGDAGRRLPPQQAADPANGRRPVRAVDRHRHGLQAGAAVGRGLGRALSRVGRVGPGGRTACVYGLKWPVGTPSGGTGGRSAARAPQAVQSVFIDDRLDPGEVGDLVDQGLGVIAPQGDGRSTARGGSGVGGREAQLLRGHQGAFGPGMSRSRRTSARSVVRAACRSADGIRRRGLGGVGGIEVEPGLEVGNPLVQLSDPTPERLKDGHEGRLASECSVFPERFRDRKRGARTQGLHSLEKKVRDVGAYRRSHGVRRVLQRLRGASRRSR